MTRLSRRTGIKLATYRRPRLGASVRFLVSAPVSFVTCNLIGRRRVRRVTRSRTQSVTNVLTERLDQSRPNCNSLSLSLSFSFVLAVRLYAKRLGRIKRIYIYIYVYKQMYEISVGNWNFYKDYINWKEWKRKEMYKIDIIVENKIFMNVILEFYLERNM